MPNLIALILRFNGTVVEKDDKFVIIYTKVSHKNEIVGIVRNKTYLRFSLD